MAEAPKDGRTGARGQTNGRNGGWARGRAPARFPNPQANGRPLPDPARRFQSLKTPESACIHCKNRSKFRPSKTPPSHGFRDFAAIKAGAKNGSLRAVSGGAFSPVRHAGGVFPDSDERVCCGRAPVCAFLATFAALQSGLKGSKSSQKVVFWLNFKPFERVRVVPGAVVHRS